MITSKKLKNNLLFLHKEVKGSNIVDVRLTLRTGHAYDHKVGVPAGTAHFLEHIVHEKTEKYENREKLMNIIAPKGGIRNAGTYTTEKMNFFATVLKGEVEFAADYVSQLTSHAVLTNEATEKHRSIIVQEYLSKLKDPEIKCWLAFRELAYKDLPFRYMALGDIESINAVTRQDMQKFYDDRFKAENSVLTIYGDISNDNANILADKYFTELKTDLTFSEEKNFKNEEYPFANIAAENLSKRYKNIYLPDEQAVVFFGGVHGGRVSKNYYAISVLLNILAGDFTSILYKILRDERHLLYHVGFGWCTYDTTGNYMFKLNLATANIQESIDVIKQEVDKIAKGEIDESIITICKSRIKAREIFSSQKIQDQADVDATAALLFLDIKDNDEYIEKIDAVAKEEIIEAAKYLKDHMNLLAVCSNKKQEYEF